MTGCTTQECAVKMGKILNVQKIVIGSLAKLVGLYYITANIVDVETGQITLSERVECPAETELISAVEKLSRLLGARMLGKRVPYPEERRVDLTRANVFISRVIDEKTVAINRGMLDGVKKRDLYSIWKPEEMTFREIGKIIISSVGKEESTGELVKIKTGEKPTVGYPVIKKGRLNISGMGAGFKYSKGEAEDRLWRRGKKGWDGSWVDYFNLFYHLRVLKRWFLEVNILPMASFSKFYSTGYVSGWWGWQETVYKQWNSYYYVPICLQYQICDYSSVSPYVGIGVSYCEMEHIFSDPGFSPDEISRRLVPIVSFGIKVFGLSSVQANLDLKYFWSSYFYDYDMSTLSISAGLSYNW